VLTRLFHFVSLRKSATVSKTCSGGQASRIMVATRDPIPEHPALRAASD
jgi:hypothetical protein